MFEKRDELMHTDLLEGCIVAKTIMNTSIHNTQMALWSVHIDLFLWIVIL